MFDLAVSNLLSCTLDKCVLAASISLQGVKVSTLSAHVNELNLKHTIKGMLVVDLVTIVLACLCYAHV